jgi:hypothetical protein
MQPVSRYVLEAVGPANREFLIMKSTRPSVLAHTRFLQNQERIRGLSLSGKFAYIYETNMWGGEESRSGVGAAASATAHLRPQLLELLLQIQTRTLLDIPCGDFGWISEVADRVPWYVGADIVDELIQKNIRDYSGPNKIFVRLDVTSDTLPEADVILCRDCLVHFSFENIFKALANIKRGTARYLATTTFPGHPKNHDIMDGDWRLLNLQIPPFSFPDPIRVINEGCTELDGTYADKSLGVWRIADLR